MYDDVPLQSPVNWGCSLNYGLSGWWPSLPHLSLSDRLWDATGNGNHGALSSSFKANWKMDPIRKLGVTRTTDVSSTIQQILVGLTSAGTYTMSGWFAALGFGTGGFGFNTLFGFANSGYSFVAFNSLRGVTVWGSGSSEPSNATIFTWPNTSEWQHLTVVRSGNSGSYLAYFNGSLAGTVAAGSGFATTAPFAIQGRGDSAINFDGYGADFRLYASRALSATEALRLYEDSRDYHPDTMVRSKRVRGRATIVLPTAIPENPALRMLAMGLI